jgi:hypothetical protein
MVKAVKSEGYLRRVLQLTFKRLVEFAVADNEEIEWSSLPFNRLTMSEKDREVIMALTEAHMGQLPKEAFDDMLQERQRLLTYSCSTVPVQFQSNFNLHCQQKIVDSRPPKVRVVFSKDTYMPILKRSISPNKYWY